MVALLLMDSSQPPDMVLEQALNSTYQLWQEPLMLRKREAQLLVQMFWPLRTSQSMVMSERKQQILQSVRQAGILQLR